MKIIVDVRETALFAALSDLSGVEKAALPIGDVAFFIESDPCVILERKSVEDLAASHRDGRYKEQRARLLGERGKGIAIGYLLEVPTFISSSRFSDADLKNAILRLQFRYTIPVIQSASIADSASYIKAIVAALSRDPECFKGGLATTATAAAAVYTEAIHVRKADNSTPDRVFRSLLRVVPGLGSVAVEGLVAATGGSLAALQSKTEAELAAIGVGKRRLGPAMAKTVYAVFHN